MNVQWSLGALNFMTMTYFTWNVDTFKALEAPWHWYWKAGMRNLCWQDTKPRSSTLYQLKLGKKQKQTLMTCPCSLETWTTRRSEMGDTGQLEKKVEDLQATVNRLSRQIDNYFDPKGKVRSRQIKFFASCKNMNTFKIFANYVELGFKGLQWRRWWLSSARFFSGWEWKQRKLEWSTGFLTVLFGVCRR